MSKTLSTGHANRGRLLLLAAAVMWSTSGWFIKNPRLASLSGPELASYRAIFAALCVVPFVHRCSIRWRPMLVPMVIAFALMNVLFVTSMTKTTVAATVFLQYTSTVWTFVFGVLFLRERVERGNLFALVCGIGGIVWIIASDTVGLHTLGNGMALASGIAFAVVILCLRYLRDEDPIWLIALNHGVTALILLPFLLLSRDALDSVQWSLVASMGVVQMGVPYVVFAGGIRYVNAQEAALILLLEPILNPMWVWLFWHEPASMAIWIGGAFIVGGLAIRYFVMTNSKV